MSKEKKEKVKPGFVIDHYEFDYDLGLKILKGKYRTKENLFKTAKISKSTTTLIEEDWDKAGNVTTMEALSLTNIEARRICFRYIGIENIFAELKPTLVDTQTLDKTTYVDPEGNIKPIKDTYELYVVDGSKITEGTSVNRTIQNFYILRCKCPSSDREYLIYIQDIWNRRNTWGAESANKQPEKKPDAIEAVAWTITTDVKKEDVDYIIRQGDCILVKTKKDEYEKCATRHLDKEEYLEKVRYES